MFLERNRATLPAEPVNSGIIAVDAGISQVLTGVLSTPVTQQGGTDLSAIKLRENANTQENNNHSEEGDSTEEEDNSSVEEVGSDHYDENECKSGVSLAEYLNKSDLITPDLKTLFEEMRQKCDDRYAKMSETVSEMISEIKKVSKIEGIPTEEEEPTPEARMS